MSGLARQMKRDKQKAQYARFKRAWNDEKRFQQYLVDSGQAQIVEKVVGKDKIKVIVAGTDNTETQLLGRKPTFSMWVQSMNNRIEAAKAAPQDEKKVEVEDLSWSEGG